MSVFSRFLRIILDSRVVQMMKEIGARHLIRRQWPHHKVELWMRLIADKLGRTYRWHNFYTKRPENILEHMFKQVLTGVLMVSLELKHGTQGLTEFEGIRIIAALAFHDLGECEAHDFPRTFKDDPKIGPMLKEIEDRKLKDVIRFLPEEAQEFILTTLEAMENRAERIGRFFDAIEWVGYLLFSFAESTSEGNPAFLDVLYRSIAQLKERGYVDEFASVRMVLDAHAEKIYEAFANSGLELPDDLQASIDQAA